MEEELQKLGLNGHEAKVYLAALGLGPSGAAQLADFTNIKRPTVYLALENLIKQGLVSENFVEKKRLFLAEKPAKLEKLTKRMRRQVIDAEILLESILPELAKYPKEHNEEPKVIFYSGLEGIKNVLLDVSATNEVSRYFFGSSNKILQSLLKSKDLELLSEAKKFRQKQSRPKIYFITDGGIKSIKGPWEKALSKSGEMKILPYIIGAGSGFIIYDDKLAVLSFENKPFAAAIKSKEVFAVVKVMYQLIWESLPEERQK